MYAPVNSLQDPDLFFLFLVEKGLRKEKEKETSSWELQTLSVENRAGVDKQGQQPLGLYWAFLFILKV